MPDGAATLAEQLRARREAHGRLRNEGRPDRFARRMAITAAIERLATRGGVNAIAEDVATALGGACGFSRVLFSRVERQEWIPVSAHVSSDQSATPFAWQCGARIPVRAMHLEHDVIRRRTPILVVDPLCDRRVSQSLLRDTASSPFVVAPVMAGRRVVGLLHVDRVSQNRAVDCEDRDDILAFADALGVLWESRVLWARLEQQTAALERALLRVADEVDPRGHPAARCAVPPNLPTTSPRTARSVGLTPAELDVLELLATGLPNAEIAARLCIAYGTVKSRVKRIYVKLGVHNRGGAAVFYLREWGGAGRS